MAGYSKATALNKEFSFLTGTYIVFFLGITDHVYAFEIQSVELSTLRHNTLRLKLVFPVPSSYIMCFVKLLKHISRLYNVANCLQLILLAT